MKYKILVLICIIIICNNVNLHAQPAKSDYKIADKISVEGDEGWDYLTVDDLTNRLFVSHGTIVQVIDLKTNKLTGTIKDLKGVHGIALANDVNKGFITNGKDSSVTVFDYNTLKVLAKVPVTGKNPDALLYDQFTHRVFVLNGRTSNATVIDAKTNKIAETIALAGKPEEAVSDNKGKIYVNIEDKSMISVIDAKTLKVINSWSIAPGEEPSGLAFDIANNILFSVCSNKLMVISDALTGKVITTLPIGKGVDGAAFDPIKKIAYSSNGEGTLTVVKEESKDKFSVVENFATQKGARTIAISNKTHHIYLPTAEFGNTPEPTKENPRPHREIIHGSFVILDIAPVK